MEIYAQEIKNYQRDSNKSLRSWEIRRRLKKGLASLDSVMMWSVFAAIILSSVQIHA